MADRRSIEMGKGHFSISADSSPLRRGLDLAAAEFQRASNLLTKIGMPIASIGAAIFASLTPGAISYAGYEQSLANLRAAANPTASEFARLRTQIEAVAKNTGTDFVDVTNGFAELVKAGVSVQSVLSGVGEAAIRFARVSGMQAAEVAIVLADAMNMFGREGLTASQTANVMNRAADAVSLSLREVSEAFANGGGVAASYGQTMEDTATIFAIFAKEGSIKGADAGTLLKTVMTRLATGTESAGAAMRELGLNVYDAAGNVRPMVDILGQLETALAGRRGEDRNRLLQDLGGSFGIRGLNALLQSGTAGWRAMQDSMSGALTVEQKFDIMTNTLTGSLKKFWVHLQAIAVAVGEALAPALRVVGAVALPVLELFEQFIKANENAVQVVAGVGAALLAGGGALMALGAAVYASSYAFTGLNIVLTVVKSGFGLLTLAQYAWSAATVTASAIASAAIQAWSAATTVASAVASAVMWAASATLATASVVAAALASAAVWTWAAAVTAANAAASVAMWIWSGAMTTATAIASAAASASIWAWSAATTAASAAAGAAALAWSAMAVAASSISSAAMWFFNGVLTVAKAGYAILTSGSAIWAAASTVASAIAAAGMTAYNVVVTIAHALTYGLKVALIALGAVVTAVFGGIIVVAGGAALYFATKWLMSTNIVQSAIARIQSAVAYLTPAVVAFGNVASQYISAFAGVFVTQFFAVTERVRGSFDRIAGAVRSSALSMAESFSTALNGIVAAGQQAAAGITDAFSAGRWDLVWNIAKTAAMLAWQHIKNFAVESFIAAKYAAQVTFFEISDLITDAIGGAWNSVQLVVADVLDWIDAAMSDGFMSMAGRLTATFSNAWWSIASAAISAWQSVNNFIFQSISRIAGALTGAFGSKIMDMLGFGAPASIADESQAAINAANANIAPGAAATGGRRASLEMSQWFERQIEEVNREMRDSDLARTSAELAAATRSSNAGEIARLQRELDSLNMEAWFAAQIEEVNRSMPGARPPTFDPNAGGGAGGLRGSVIVGTSNQALFGSLGTVGGTSPAERAARDTRAMLDEIRDLHRDTVAALRAVERVAGARVS